MSVVVLRGGTLSTFQDLGRHGHQHLGIPACGAMDERSHRLANLLAGNDGDVATLEMTLVGPRLEFARTACIAVCGAEMAVTRRGEPLPTNRPLVVRAGEVVDFGRCERGARAYLAVHGGFGIEPVMGSASTSLRGGFGGWQGRALRKGDVVPLVAPLPDDCAPALGRELWDVRLYVPGSIAHVARRVVRIVRSAQWTEFTAESCAALITEPYTVGVDSERMGYRLEGPRLALESPRQMLSEGLAFGTIQVPEDGRPIVLMADRQTTGGYPKIANVISVDLPLMAQMPPGARVRFEATSLEAAVALDARREAHFGEMRESTAPIREAIGRRAGRGA